MLKTVAVSSNKKTGPIAVTYRAGRSDVFGTCPKTCKLNPRPDCGSAGVDRAYMRAVYDAVPRGGLAWTYSHYDFKTLPKPAPGKTTINASADTVAAAVRAFRAGSPVCYTAPEGDAGLFPAVIKGIKFVRCPAELSKTFTCADCGNGQPLCARGNRPYVIVFTAHGPQKKRVGTGTGGCYGTSGPVAIAWHGTKKTGAQNDAAALATFAAGLRRGSLLRHHVLGDLGHA